VFGGGDVETGVDGRGNDVGVETSYVSVGGGKCSECSLLLHNIVLQDSVNDTWRWLLDPIHGYSVQEAYKFLTHSGDTVDMTLVDDVWHRHILLKVSLLA